MVIHPTMVQYSDIPGSTSQSLKRCFRKEERKLVINTLRISTKKQSVLVLAVLSCANSCAPCVFFRVAAVPGGCLEQMRDGGGGWIKHTGHQHWRDVLPRCVPTTEEEAGRAQEDPTALCRRDTYELIE